MRYFARYENGELIGVETGYGQTEITRAEYDRLLEEIKSRCGWVEKVCADPAAIDLCPPDWRIWVLTRAEEEKQIAAQLEQQRKNAPVSDAELGGMIQEVL